MAHYTRWQTKSVLEAMDDIRVTLLTGARQCGKTTLAKSLIRNGIEYRTLDDSTLASAAKQDPHSFVEHQNRTLIIDEIQRVPELIVAIKKAVDENQQPGRFLLTGSADIQSLPSVTESLAGRARKIRLRPLTQGEILGSKPRFFDIIRQRNLHQAMRIFKRDEIMELALKGGFPEALDKNQLQRRRWHKAYIDALIDKDLKNISNIRRVKAMRTLVEALAAWSSKLINIADIGRDIGIKREALDNYVNALQALYIFDRVPAWTKTDYEHVAKKPKIFAADSGVMASILGWKADHLRLNSDRLGKLFETFVYTELQAQVDAQDGAYELYHYRDNQKREIDFLIKHEDGDVIGLEVKASTTVGKSDFKHLRWFDENQAKGHTFTGCVLYAGDQPVQFGENFLAIPFHMMWH